MGPQHEATQIDGVSGGYDFTLHYHPSKANVVANALCPKSRRVLDSVASREWQMLKTVGQLRLQYSDQAQAQMDGVSGGL